MVKSSLVIFLVGMSSTLPAVDVSLHSVNGITFNDSEISELYGVRLGVSSADHSIFLDRYVTLRDNNMMSIDVMYEYKFFNSELWSTAFGLGTTLLTKVRSKRSSTFHPTAALTVSWLDQIGFRIQFAKDTRSAGIVLKLI